MEMENDSSKKRNYEKPFLETVELGTKEEIMQSSGIKGDVFIDDQEGGSNLSGSGTWGSRSRTFDNNDERW